MPPLTTVCADIGSVPSGNFGWWSQAGTEGTKPSQLAEHVAALLNADEKVALGFECPLFVPLAESELFLTSARPGEGSRSWSAGAGCGALATGIVQVAWVLQEVRRMLSAAVPAHVQWSEFMAAPGRGLLLWEAFVTGTAKGSTHTLDARAGAEAFIATLPNPDCANAVRCAGQIHSLVGAALLRTGWRDDLSLLRQSCLVIRAVAN